jgi:hypothetical protein
MAALQDRLETYEEENACLSMVMARKAIELEVSYLVEVALKVLKENAEKALAHNHKYLASAERHFRSLRARLEVTKWAPNQAQNSLYLALVHLREVKDISQEERWRSDLGRTEQHRIQEDSSELELEH